MMTYPHNMIKTPLLINSMPNPRDLEEVHTDSLTDDFFLLYASVSNVTPSP